MIRHIHEFVYTQTELPDVLDEFYKPKTKLWSDLIQIYSPAMWINSASDADANAMFVGNSRDGLKVVAIKKIEAFEEVVVAYS